MKNFKIMTLIFLVSALLLTGCSAGTPAASAEPAASAMPEVSTAPVASAAPEATAAPESSEAPATGNAAKGTLALTLDELSAYNGENGNPAYIAVDGVIYDVTNVPQWRNGKHNGFTAGKDLTNEIKTISPHGTSKLKGVPVVGKIAP